MEEEEEEEESRGTLLEGSKCEEQKAGCSHLNS